MTKKNGRKVPLAGKCCSQIEFYDFLKKNVLSRIDDTAIKEYLENEINCENFLPKQVNKGNSVIPYQVHLFELKAILKNMEANDVKVYGTQTCLHMASTNPRLRMM